MSNFQKTFKKIRNVLRDLFIPPLIYKILRNKKESKYEGLHGLDQSLQKYLNFKNGFFVELGANNGVLQSNTFFFEKFKGWTGVLVEPVLHNFFECKKNRPNSKVYCYACTSFDYKDRFVEVIYSNLMSVPRGLESDILDPVSHAHDGLKFLGANEDNIYFGAAACALNLILEKANAPSVIDLLSLDVEGAEIGAHHIFPILGTDGRDLGVVEHRSGLGADGGGAGADDSPALIQIGLEVGRRKLPFGEFIDDGVFGVDGSILGFLRGVFHGGFGFLREGGFGNEWEIFLFAAGEGEAEQGEDEEEFAKGKARLYPAVQ
jgi:hypothetical protein